MIICFDRNVICVFWNLLFESDFFIYNSMFQSIFFNLWADVLFYDWSLNAGSNIYTGLNALDDCLNMILLWIILYHLHSQLCSHRIRSNWYHLVYYHLYFYVCLHIILLWLQCFSASTISSCLMPSLCDEKTITQRWHQTRWNSKCRRTLQPKQNNMQAYIKI